jgi:hypothetical protein
MPPPYMPNPAFQRPLLAEPGYRLPIKALDVPRYLSSFEAFCPKRRTCRGLSYSQPDTLSTSKTSRPLFLEVWFDESSRLNIVSIEQAWHYAGFREQLALMSGNTDGEGPRNVISSTATNVADPTTDPRWGTVGKQKIVDEGRRRAFELQDQTFGSTCSVSARAREKQVNHRSSPQNFSCTTGLFQIARHPIRNRFGLIPTEAFHHEQMLCQSDAQLFNGSEQRVLSHTRVIALPPPHDTQEGIWAIPMLVSA